MKLMEKQYLSKINEYEVKIKKQGKNSIAK
jgi:hypothetical protein